MDEQLQPVGSAPSPWSGGRSARDRTTVGRAVTALLDALAPEQTLTRAQREQERIERYRMPTGCVLQGATAALTVSWFADGTHDSSFGELHVLLWSGVVSRRGAQSRKGATLAHSLVLLPDEARLAEGGGIWRAADGRVFDTASLAAYCAELLERQLLATQHA